MRRDEKRRERREGRENGRKREERNKVEKVKRIFQKRGPQSALSLFLLLIIFVPGISLLSMVHTICAEAVRRRTLRSSVDRREKYDVGSLKSFERSALSALQNYTRKYYVVTVGRKKIVELMRSLPVGWKLL